MHTKLLLIEGIPGSGKTTFARKTAAWYAGRGVTAGLFTEGQPHPADLAWQACVPRAAYAGLLEKYAGLRGDIEGQTVFEGETAIVAYTRVETGDGDFYRELAAFEVYGGRAPDEVFCGLHYDRWGAFARKAAAGEDADAVYIFECAFLQNPVNELLFWRGADESAVIAHGNRLLAAAQGLNPTLIYLSQPDIRAAIGRVAAARVSPDGNWIDHCVAYCESTPYGKKHGLTGLEGAIAFFTARKALEMKILAQLPIPHVVIENEDGDWDRVWARIADYLERRAA